MGEPLDLDALAAIATSVDSYQPPCHVDAVLGMVLHPEGCQCEANKGRYRGAFVPPTVLALIAQAQRAEALERLVRLMAETGGRCQAYFVRNGRLRGSLEQAPCSQRPGHPGLCGGASNVAVDGKVDIASPWTPADVALLASVTSEGEVDR